MGREKRRVTGIGGKEEKKTQPGKLVGEEKNKT